MHCKRAISDPSSDHTVLRTDPLGRPACGAQRLAVSDPSEDGSSRAARPPRGGTTFSAYPDADRLAIVWFQTAAVNLSQTDAARDRSWPRPRAYRIRCPD